MMGYEDRAKNLGDLIAKRMEQENPDLIRDVRKLVKDKLLYQKPWYTRFYEKVRDYIYKG